MATMACPPPLHGETWQVTAFLKLSGKLAIKVVERLKNSHNTPWLTIPTCDGTRTCMCI